MEMIEGLFESLLEPETILVNFGIPLLVAVVKYLFNKCVNGTIVTRFGDKRANWYIYVIILKVWKITIIPLGLSMGVMLIPSIIFYEVDMEATIIATVVIILSFSFLWALLALLKLKKLKVMIKTIISTVVCSILFLFLRRQFSSNEQIIWSWFVCVLVLILCLELFLIEDGYYDNKSNKVLHIVESLISIVEAGFFLGNEVSWYGAIYVSLAFVVVTIDMWIWRNKTEPRLEKRVIVKAPKNDIKEYVTSDTIKKTFSGDICFRDNDNHRVYISDNFVKQIQFDSYSKESLSRKIEEINIADDEFVVAPNLEWYVKAVTNDWLHISTWDGTVTKNILYPKKDVFWIARKYK